MLHNNLKYIVFTNTKFFILYLKIVALGLSIIVKTHELINLVIKLFLGEPRMRIEPISMLLLYWILILYLP